MVPFKTLLNLHFSFPTFSNSLILHHLDDSYTLQLYP